ncbi:hypothetical protein GQ53DRAFT_771516 [Thozetella sp. PMI_491]|nr:hypothetical protein GQ53DRAFT_771516 [Thozetella sp. PMI_491]
MPHNFQHSMALQYKEKIYKLLKRDIESWSYENWTSRFRSEAGHPPFRGLEKDFSDFTYTDSDGKLSLWFQDAGVPPSPGWTNSTVFHLEVKTTPNDCDEPFFMRKYADDTDHAYVLIRVFGIDGETPGGVPRLFSLMWSNQRSIMWAKRLS